MGKTICGGIYMKKCMIKLKWICLNDRLIKIHYNGAMLTTQLKQFFQFSEFKPGQQEIVQSIVAGRDVVALMPTGGGKSLCYQLPALVSGGLTIVISPLIALMKDQVDSLRARGIEAVFINSSLNFNQINDIVADLKHGKVKLLYVAPERLKNSEFVQLINELDVSLVAVDEAHCVSSWGHDFRPDYMLIQNFIAQFTNRPAVAAFTATATPEVRDDIVKHLGLTNPKIFVRGFDRPNLMFEVQSGLSQKKRKSDLLNLVQSTAGSGIVYTLTRKMSEEIAGYFSANGIKAAAYHAGLEGAVRTRVQNEFMDNQYKVIVATVAFGMGVNKADIRFVIHCGLPASVENYYQEAGRAGRDGEPARCILLASKQDNGLHSFLINKSQEEMIKQGKSRLEINALIDIKYKKLRQMKDYAEAFKCRRLAVLKYFADPDIEKYQNGCGGCDVCLGMSNSKMILDNTKTTKRLKDINEITGTVAQSVDFYQKGFSLDQIAKIRELGVRTIWNHLIEWYAVGGDFRVEEHITEDQRQQIIAVIDELGDYSKLRPIKDLLPENISYEQIKIVIAKIEQEKNVIIKIT